MTLPTGWPCDWIRVSHTTGSSSAFTPCNKEE